MIVFVDDGGAVGVVVILTRVRTGGRKGRMHVDERNDEARAEEDSGAASESVNPGSKTVL